MTTGNSSRAWSSGVLQRVIDQRVQDAGRLAVFTHLSRVVLLFDELQQECLGGVQLNFVDYSLLRVLQLSGPPHALSPTRLAGAVVRSTGGMTKIIDRLERRGLVARDRDPDDRRGVLVRLTDAGLELATSASDAYTDGRTAVLEGISDGDIAQIDGAICQLVAAFEAHHPAVRSPGPRLPSVDPPDVAVGPAPGG